MIIKYIRRKLGLSQKQFAKSAGLCRTSVAHWESDRKPPIHAAYKIIDFAKKNRINITLEDIYPRS